MAMPGHATTGRQQTSVFGVTRAKVAGRKLRLKMNRLSGSFHNLKDATAATGSAARSRRRSS